MCWNILRALNTSILVKILKIGQSAGKLFNLGNSDRQLY